MRVLKHIELYVKLLFLFPCIQDLNTVAWITAPPTIISKLYHRTSCHYVSHCKTLRSRLRQSSLYAVKKTKKQQGAAAGLKGFGAVIGTSSVNKDHDQSLVVDIDRSKPTLSFYENSILSQPQNTAISENLKRTALAYTYNTTIENDFKLRGVISTRDISKGSDIISIPYEMAIDLGLEGNDPTTPAALFLKDYCSTLLSPTTPSNKSRQHYYRMLPPYDSIDCRGCTNFFSDEALAALQCPYIVAETYQRRLQIQQRYEFEIQDQQLLWIDGVTPISMDHLTWAVWIITSRVLTVQATGPTSNDDEVPIQYRRLLIPYLDMCNHDRTSKHKLTGRALPGGLLRIVAGTNVKSGSTIDICYGGGMNGNDRFLYEYGFLDNHDDAYTFVAMDLLGLKRRSNNGNDSNNSYLSLIDRTECLAALRSTSIEEDERLLQSSDGSSRSDMNVNVAIQYRIGIKKALQQLKGEQQW